MSTTTTPRALEHADFVGEVARRKANRGLAAADKAPAADPRLLAMTGADLADAIELLAPKAAAKGRKAKAAKAAPAKPERTAAEKAATEARRLAWEFRAAERKAGRKVSYADACAIFGTTPAKASA